jgi:hypothetical protein
MDPRIHEARDWAMIALRNWDTQDYRKVKENLTSIVNLLSETIADSTFVSGGPPVQRTWGWRGFINPFALYAGSFAGITHWDGDARATDWYVQVPIGTWLGFPLPLFVRRFPTSGPQGTIINAVATVPEGPWRDWGFLFGHVLDSVQGGYIEPWQPFFQYGNTGIEMLPGEAGHIHFAVDSPSPGGFSPDGKGDVSAAGALQALGFPVDIVPRIPSPQDYALGRASQGHFT